MKAFLLAAGHGTRLKPLTNKIPKCLVPICGVPMLEIWLEICRRAGIDEVLVNLHAHADVVRGALAGKSPGVDVRVAEEPVLLGSAGTLRVHRDWVARESSFWVLYADVLTSANLNGMLAFHTEHKSDATIGVYQVPDPNRCGIVSFGDDYLVRGFVEKPAQPECNWAFSGLMIACPDVLERIPQQLPADVGFDLLPQLVDRMVAYPIQDFLTDIGTMENYQAAQTTWPGLPVLEEPSFAPASGTVQGRRC